MNNLIPDITENVTQAVVDKSVMTCLELKRPEFDRMWPDERSLSVPRPWKKTS